MNIGWNDRESRNFAKISCPTFNAPFDVLQCLVARFCDMHQCNNAPILSVKVVTIFTSGTSRQPPIIRVGGQCIVRSTADRQHPQTVFTGSQSTNWGTGRCDSYFHVRTGIARQLQAGFAQVEPVGLHRNHLTAHQRHDRIKRLIEHSALVLRVDPHPEGIADKGAWAHPEHRPSPRLIIKLGHTRSDCEGVVIR